MSLIWLWVRNPILSSRSLQDRETRSREHGEQWEHWEQRDGTVYTGPVSTYRTYETYQHQVDMSRTTYLHKGYRVVRDDSGPQTTVSRFGGRVTYTISVI
jgi:hypothetical protein